MKLYSKRRQTTSDAWHLVLTWPSCSWHCTDTGHQTGARVTRLHSLVITHRLPSLTQSHLRCGAAPAPHSLPAGPRVAESGICRAPEDLEYLQHELQTWLQNCQLSQWRNTTITWKNWLTSHLIYHKLMQLVSTQTLNFIVDWFFEKCPRKLKGSGGLI